MKYVWSITAKELRGFFHSPVALIFLATFLGVVLFTFFWYETFFSRGLADVRPMFEWLPLLLIFLVAALTMRLWSEEQKLGTLEMLMTLPVPLYKLVLGKFLAGIILVGLALVMTLGLPITVSMMGDLDWGPVIGGYVGALLLAAAYLSIGLCVSALTDNQIVALIFTTLACALFYLPGADAVAGLFANHGGEILRGIGTGSRFESVARGVIDLRDLAYYGGLVAFFLTLNTAILLAKRWSAGARSARERHRTKIAVALVFANVLALNLWLAPLGGARADLTQDRLFSLSSATKEIVRDTSEPLVIRGYFSGDTHPYLAPIIPHIRDILREYDLAGGPNVRVDIVDPFEDEELEAEAREDYGIESVPFQFAARHEASLVNAYFHILVKYGDQYEVLSIDELVDVRASGPEDVEVQPSNLEYNITRAVRRVTQGFESIENLFASPAGDVRLTLYVTPDTLPDDLRDIPGTVQAVADELAGERGDRFQFETQVPDTEAEQLSLAEEHGFEPFAVSLLSEEFFYMHLLVEVGDRSAPISLADAVTEDGVSEGNLRAAIVEGLKRAAPGFLKTVGFVAPEPEQPPGHQMHGQQQPPMPPQSFTQLQEVLGSEYDVEEIDPNTSDIPGEVDTVVLAGPADLSDAAVRRLDQFLMRGGGLIVLAGRHRLDLAAQDLVVEPVTTGLEDALATYGIEVSSELILDERNDTFPMPVDRQVGGRPVQEMRMVPYPFFVRATRDQVDDDSPVSAGLRGGIFHWASPLYAQGDENLDIASIVRSSDNSWLQSGHDVRPDFTRYPEQGFARPADLDDEDRGPLSLAATARGRFNSHFAPSGEEDDDEPREDEPAERLLERSVADARLGVVGSSSFVSDELVQVSRQLGSDLVMENFQLVQNLVDWSVADTDLLEIRSGGRHTRLLEVDEDERRRWELINYGLVALFLLIVIGATSYSRRMLTPMKLAPAREREGARKREEDEA